MVDISLKTKQLAGFAFVDDTDLCVDGPQVISPNISTIMQSTVDHWEGLLQATGGALVPTKCFWYLIDLHFSNNTWKYLPKSKNRARYSQCRY